MALLEGTAGELKACSVYGSLTAGPDGGGGGMAPYADIRLTAVSHPLPPPPGRPLQCHHMGADGTRSSAQLGAGHNQRGRRGVKGGLQSPDGGGQTGDPRV